MDKGLPGEEGKECTKEDMQHLWKLGGEREHGELEGQKDILSEAYSVRKLGNLRWYYKGKQGPSHTVSCIKSIDFILRHGELLKVLWFFRFSFLRREKTVSG